MGKKYAGLTKHLASLDEGKWTATFPEIEAVLGASLPGSARTYQAWWSNQMRSQSLSWQLAGWKTTELDLGSERVTFVYVGGEENEDEGEGGDEALRAVAKPLTIAEAKAGLAATFGVDPAQIDITIRA